MSEFSESYHIKTDDPDSAIRKLTEAGLRGLVFPPKAGWLTFVPYGLGGFPFSGAGAQPILDAVERPVLWYLYGEDHGWQFALLRPKTEPVAFASWWDPEASLDDTNLDLEALAEVMPSPDRRHELKDILRAMTPEEVFADPPAPRFAEILGLPAYRWLSEAYALSDPEPCYRDGAWVIGGTDPNA